MNQMHTPQFDNNTDAVPPGGRMECGVCWYVFDPAVGDDVWQIPAGTPFSALPDHWRCPECDTEKSKFLALDVVADSANNGQDDVASLIKAYRRVDQERMQDIPFRNTHLTVEAVDFQPWQGDQLGVIITPWFMNLVLLAGAESDWTAHRHGDLVTQVLPSGRYQFVHGDLEGFGVLQSCSLMSPVTDFEDMEAARTTAQEVMRLMLVAPDGTAEPTGTPLKTEPDVEPMRLNEPISRRELFRGRHTPSTPKT